MFSRTHARGSVFSCAQVCSHACVRERCASACLTTRYLILAGWGIVLGLHMLVDGGAPRRPCQITYSTIWRNAQAQRALEHEIYVVSAASERQQMSQHCMQHSMQHSQFVLFCVGNALAPFKFSSMKLNLLRVAACLYVLPYQK